MIAHPSASQKACSCAIICWKVDIEGASYQTLDRKQQPADNRSMRRGRYALLPLLALAAAACGAPSGKALDTKVEAAVVAQQGGRQVVSSVDCSDQAPPADTVAGGLGTAAQAHCKAGSPAAPAGSTATAAPDHVCSIRIPGHGRERWAVRILGSNVQLLF